MQRRVLKNVGVLFLILVFTSQITYSQISGYRLQQADSLFNAKQFTQALGHYEQIFSKKEYTPSMLLKMAFVQEGLNKTGEALYYLNLYYLATADESVLQKMAQLSQMHNLDGYELSEADRALSFYHKYHFQITLVIMALMLFLFSLAVYMKRRNYKPVAVIVVLLLLSVGFAIHVNAAESDVNAIVAGEVNYLMAGPSGAAPVVEIINAGHRLQIVKRHDVWVQVQWKGKTAFIKENHLLPVIL